MSSDFCLLSAPQPFQYHIEKIDEKDEKPTGGARGSGGVGDSVSIRALACGVGPLDGQRSERFLPPAEASMALERCATGMCIHRSTAGCFAKAVHWARPPLFLSTQLRIGHCKAFTPQFHPSLHMTGGKS